MIRLTGYETIGPAGFGAAGTAWNVRNSEGLPGVAIETRASASRLTSLQALHHPNLPEILTLHRTEVGAVMVMDLIAGHSLGVIMGARHQATAAEIAGLWRGLGDALAALHHRGVIHGDVSPSNVIIRDSGQPVLIDIGGHGGQQKGHAGFVAPEEGDTPRAPRDVWQLARTLLWVSGDDGAVRRALGRALEEDPEKRPNAREFALQWIALASPEPLRVPPASRLAAAGMRNDDGDTWMVTQDPPRRWWRPAVVAAAIGLGLGVASILASGPVIGASTDGPYAVDQITELVRERDRALSSTDASALAALYADGSASFSTDLDRIEQYSALGITLDGYETVLHGIDVISDAGHAVIAELVISPSSHERVHTNGEREDVPAGAERCVRLTIEAGLIDDIGACQ